MEAQDLLDPQFIDRLVGRGQQRRDAERFAALLLVARSASRRADSAMTSQVSAAPMTSPTISSHQLNSAFTTWPPG